MNKCMYFSEIIRSSCIFLLLFWGGFRGIAQEVSFTRDYLSFNREKMEFEDDQLLLFAGRGYVCPREFSMSGFTNVEFLPIQLPFYNFYINLKEKTTNLLIRDDVAVQWDKWETQRTGWDPLACNFRSYAPKVLVTQDEEWKPNLYTRTGTFFKDIEDKRINFSIKTATCVSAVADEVLLKYEIFNRDTLPLCLSLLPVHEVKELPCAGKEGSARINLHTPFIVSSDMMEITLASDINTISDEGFEIEIAPRQSRCMYFSVSFNLQKKNSPIYQSDIKKRFDKAQEDIGRQIDWVAQKMPKVETSNKQINEMYYRSLLSVLMCRWDRENYVIRPFWTVGTWPYTISWDNSYASDVLAMLEPESLKETIRLNLGLGQRKYTYIPWNGSVVNMLYIQEPFAIQIMLNAYINHTGDIGILNENAEGKTFYEWMCEWAYDLHNNYTRKDGLIDVGYSTEKIIEIRTDGYNHVVPIVNGLTVDLYDELVRWAILLKKSDDAKTFIKWRDQLKKVFLSKCWNSEKKWFDNLYPNGKRGQVYTYHLFDLLASPNITGEQRCGLISHIKDNVFLGKFGFYSIARTDSVHWDRIDGDWGGGGQYAGMPTRIARNLYKIGFSELGWKVLKRYARYVDYFPYFTQNPSTDKPHQERSSMPLEISAGSAAEALIFGTFGVNIDINSISINPCYHEDLGYSVLKDFRWRGSVYDVELHKRTFVVYKNGVKLFEALYGNVFKDVLDIEE